MVHVNKCPYGNRGKQSIEFYKNGEPQIYCQGWVNNVFDELVDECDNCPDHVSNAQYDLDRWNSERTITKDEAIRELMFAKREVLADSYIDKAYDMAIEALKTENDKENRCARTIYNFLKKKIGTEITDNVFEFEGWFNRMTWHVMECYKLQKKLDEALSEPKTGKWIPVTRIYTTKDSDFPYTTIEWVDATEPDEIDAVRCSECGEIFDFQDARNWCTECGAKMIKKPLDKFTE